MIKKGFLHLLVYIMWLIAIGVGLWFFYISRNSFLGVMSNLYVRGSLARSMEVRFFEKVFVLFIGVVYAIAMLGVFEFFSFGAESPDFLDRIALVFGIELALVFLADITWFWAQNFKSHFSFRWPILIGELLLGIGLLIFSIRSHRLRTG
jgi:hypothetical protein